MSEKVKKIILIVLLVAIVVGIGCVVYGICKKATFKVENPVATIEVEGYGKIKVELYPDKAPNTVTNFIRLANRGFYNGVTFHRTIPGFVIQGGAPKGNITGSPKLSDIMDDVQNDKEYNIEGEFIANGHTENNIKHEKGVISMARADYSNYSSSLTTTGYNSANSQFFIMTDDNTALNGTYAAFGKVIEGLNIVEKISKVKVHYRSSELKEGASVPKDKNGKELPSDMPKKQPVIKSISVETYGVDYGIPKTVDVFDLNT